MIKLDQITHTNFKGKVTYVLPGGEHTDSAFKAIRYLYWIDDLNQDSPEEPEEVITSSNLSVVKNNTSDGRYFLGY